MVLMIACSMQCSIRYRATLDLIRTVLDLLWQLLPCFSPLNHFANKFVRRSMRNNTAGVFLLLALID